MPLHDVDPNISARSSLSRSSFTSTKPLNTANARINTSAVPMDHLSGIAGVQSMLKTTTETGDIGSLFGRSDGFENRFQASHRQSPAVPPSRASSHYSRTGSMRSRASKQSFPAKRSLDAWPNLHHQPPTAHDRFRASSSRSENRPFHMPESVASFSEQSQSDRRAYSITRNYPSRPALINHRSATSLRGQVPPSYYSGPMSPFHNPARLHRPALRSASPAWSETNAPRSGRSVTPAGTAYPPSKPFAEGPARYQNFPRDNANNLRSSTETESSRRINEVRCLVDPRLVGTNFSEAESRAIPNTSQTLEPPSVSKAPLNFGQSRQLQPTTNPSIRQTISYDGIDKKVNKNVVQGTPYVGFVQRVKQVLEERSSIQQSPSKTTTTIAKFNLKNETTDRPSDVPSSPVVKRLTRDMIKAAVGPPSDSGAVSPTCNPSDQLQTDDTTLDNSSLRDASSFEIGSSPSGFCSVVDSSGLEKPTDTIALDADSLPRSKGNEIHSNTEAKPVSNFDAVVMTPQVGDDSQIETEENPAVRQTVDRDTDPLETRRIRLPNFHDRSVTRPISLPQSVFERTENPKLARNSLPALEELGQPISPVFLSPTTSAPPRDLSQVIDEINDRRLSLNEPFKVDIADVDERVSIPQRPTSEEMKAKEEIVNNQISDQGSYSSISFSSPANRPLMLRPSLELVVPTGVLSPSLSGVNDRLSAVKKHQFTLPDLAEDSQEDASTTNLRMLGSKAPNFRTSGVKRTKRDNKMSNPAFIPTEFPSSYLSRKLENTRNMPSLHFSQMDLTTKLNRALGFKPKYSDEELSLLIEQPAEETDSFPVHYAQGRYQSFFSGASQGEETDMKSTDDSKPSLPIQKTLIREIERLSIPSVNALTLRLSELLPAIKYSSSPFGLINSEDTIESRIEEVDGVEIEQNPSDSNQKRASVSSALSTRRGHISLPSAALKKAAQELQLRLMKELPPLPNDSKEMIQGTLRATPDLGYPQATTKMFDESGGRLLLNLSADSNLDINKRDKSRQIHEEDAIRQIPLFGKIEESQRGGAHKKSEHQGWGQGSSTKGLLETSAEGIQAVDLIDEDTLKASKRLTPDITERIVRSMSPGPSVEKPLIPQSNTGGKLQEPDTKRIGIIGSVQRKMGRQPRVDKSGFPVDPMFLHPEERVSEPGDRYPTSGLTAPRSFNIDETRSYFSEDSSEEETGQALPIRKRLTRLRDKPSGIKQTTKLGFSLKPKHILEDDVYVQNELTWDTNEQSASDLTTLSVSHPDFVLIYDQTPLGMSKFEFQRKRLIEKLRILWCKSGKMFRLVNRSERSNNRQWLETEDLYDGV